MKRAPRGDLFGFLTRASADRKAVADFGLSPGGVSGRQVEHEDRAQVHGRCFVCGATITHLRRQPPHACRDCQSRARLVLGGALLAEVLRSTRPYPLEGSLLSFVLNPLEIDGRRCWADFVAGWVGLLQEVEPSTDMFDFMVQHCDPWPEITRSIDTVRFSSELERVGLAEVSSKLSLAARENLEQLLTWWQAVQEGRRALDAFGPIRTNEHAWVVSESLFASRPHVTQSETQAMLTRLRHLSSR